jgi:hypothetical protein
MKIFSIVKNEVDIVAQWVKYHASLVGLKNLVVLDNGSTDGTREALAKLKVTTYGVPDYRRKGEYMTALAKAAPKELVIPLDIDEFLVQYDRASNTISCNVVSALVQLPTQPVYKMNYILAKYLEEYSCAPLQATNGLYQDYGSMAKSFFHMGRFNGQIDHGNHFPTPYFQATPLCLVHYHYRNKAQYFEKIKCNVEGLGYPAGDLDELKRLAAEKCPGHHHVSSRIAILEGRFELPHAEKDPNDVDLGPLARKIASL